MAERQVRSLNQNCILFINDIIFHLLNLNGNLVEMQYINTFGSRNGKYPRKGRPHGPGSLLGEELIQSAIHAFTEKQFVMKYNI